MGVCQHLTVLNRGSCSGFVMNGPDMGYRST